MRLVFLLFPAIAAIGVPGCAGPASDPTAHAKIYVDAAIPRAVTRVECPEGEIMTLGRAIDAIGGLLPEEHDAYLQILKTGKPPIVIEARDLPSHLADPLRPGDSVYIGLRETKRAK